MAFTTLMMFQLFNVFNCRSTWRSAFSGLFENKWLLGAVALSLLTHILVIYRAGAADGVPHRAAHGRGLAGRDGGCGDAARRD